MKKLIEQLKQLKREIKEQNIVLDKLYNKIQPVCMGIENKLSIMHSNCLITDLEYEILWKHLIKGYTIRELAKDNDTTIEKMKYVYKKGLRKIIL